jgi:ubiquinone biosynthesis protein
MADGRLALVDFGIVGRLPKDMLTSIARIFTALVKRDSSAIVRGYISLSASGRDIDISGFEREVGAFLDRYYNMPLKYIRAEKFLNEMGQISSRFNLILPQDFILLGKAVFVIGGLGRELYPEFNMFEAAEPFARKLMLKRFEHSELASSVYRAADNVLALFTSFPEQWRQILSKLNRGEMKMEFEHRGLENFIVELDRSSNRLAFSLIIAAIIVGSSLIIRIDKGPRFFDYPLLGIAGYIIAGVLGLWLVVAILRSGKL